MSSKIDPLDLFFCEIDFSISFLYNTKQEGEIELFMKTIGGKHPKQNDDLSVLELVHREREAELRSFDCMIHSDKDFILALVTMPDDYIIRLYDYLLKKEEIDSIDDDRIEDVLREREMIAKLEEIPVIQEHMSPKDLDEEDESFIQEPLDTLAGTKRVRNMGPVRKLVYNIRKKRKK